MKRHPLELLSLLSGLVFLTFAGSYVVGVGIGSPPRAVFAVPLLLVGLGAAGMTTLIASQRTQPAGTVDTHSPEGVEPSV